MDFGAKINKLTRIPELLNRKKRAENKGKKKDDESSDRPPFPLKDKPSLKKPGLSTSSKPKQKQKPDAKSIKEGIGKRIDVLV